MQRDPEDILRSYEKLLEAGKFGGAYRCLKQLLSEFPKDDDLLEAIIAFACFRGDLSSGEKDEAIARFKGDIPLLLSSESGGEGRNLQFCNTIINFDLPWNPMRIEQRIGRLHRIGQTRDVFIFNLATRDTIEDHLIGILSAIRCLL